MVQWLIAMIPLGLNMAGMQGGRWPLLLASVAMLFLAVAVMPAARKRESVFLFVLAAVSLIPANLGAVVWFLESGFLEEMPLLSKLFWPVLVYWMVFNIEQVALGFAARMIWPRQYKSVFWDEV